jgi:predicted DNA-binding transcriptional regulator AlpA
MRVLSYPDLKVLGIRYSRPQLRELCRTGQFPAPIQIGPQRIAWREADIEAWQAALPTPTSHAPVAPAPNGSRRRVAPAPVNPRAAEPVQALRAAHSGLRRRSLGGEG